MSILVAGCGKTRTTDLPVEPSGFLTDYSVLSDTQSEIPGDAAPQPRLLYVNFEVDWNTYDKAMVDPVVFFTSEDVDVPEGVQQLLNYFSAELREELKKDYELVQFPQPGTLRIRTALTRAGKRNVTLDKMSTWLPFGRAWAELKGIEGKPTGVGYAKVEIEFTDTETGELLAAALDKRVGGKSVQKDFKSWSDVRAASDYWAKSIVYRLCLLRNRTNCKLPKA